MYYYDGTKHIFVNQEIDNEFQKSWDEYVDYYNNFEFDDNMIEKIQEFKKICEEKNINIKFFIMPSHISDQYLINQKCKSNYEKWKIELTKIADIYDFQYPNFYTLEEIKPDMKYFFDASHSTNIFGNIIIDFLTGNGNKCGRLLTKDNVKFYLNEDEKALNEFMKNNAQFVKQVKSKTK